ncbi:hypothetical protein [Neptunomonas sp. XY-337]|uniref:hypothetical protein n=1 Tax=Neptunomonas sp. XY-337 TaxID=2561897 RepID=UPI0010AB15D7|nr:hypothetical protein [Neptunomonas sp. XY-337]
MLRTLVLVAILIAIGVLYFAIPDPSDSETPSKSSALPSNPETQPPVESAPQLKTELSQQAEAHIAKLTETPSTAIDAREARHFVTESQLINLPELKAQQHSAVLEQVSADGSSNVAVDDGSAQSFGVAVSTFNPSSANGTQPSAQTTLAAENVRALSLANQVQLKELIDQSDSAEKRIFYIHAVNPDDEQGLWGILQSGLTETFAAGIKVSSNDKTLKAYIPDEADEVLNNRSSSYLGKLLHDKAQTTYIYNYEQGLIGQNPNLIKPGQQLIIVTFTEQELMQIYEHFQTQRD